MRNMLYWALFALLNALPANVIKSLGRGLGRILWMVLRKRRREATQAVCDRLLVSKDEAEQIARSSFIHSGQAFLEIFLVRSMDPRFLERMDIENFSRFQEIFDQKRPIVAVAGHFGAWEFLGGIINLLCTFSDQQRKGQIVVRLPKDKALAELMLHMRTLSGVEVVPHRQAARKLLACLKKKGLSAFLVDHNTLVEEAIFLPFLGLVAAVNIGPAVLAVRTNALVLPGFMLRTPDGGYRFEWREPLDVNLLKGSVKEKIRQTAEFYTEAVEEMVRMHPEQWFWMHRRWKTRPEDQN